MVGLKDLLNSIADHLDGKNDDGDLFPTERLSDKLRTYASKMGDILYGFGEFGDEYPFLTDEYALDTFWDEWEWGDEKPVRVELLQTLPEMYATPDFKTEFGWKLHATKEDAEEFWRQHVEHED